MTIEQTEVIDFIGIDKVTGEVVLTISDHLDWSLPMSHLQKLQTKLNAYLRFCESGELNDSYPAAKGRHIVIAVAAQYPPSDDGLKFFSRASELVKSDGITLRYLRVAREEGASSAT